MDVISHQEFDEIIIERRYGPSDVSLVGIQTIIDSYKGKTVKLHISYINMNSFYDLEDGYDDDNYRIITEHDR